MTKSVALVVAMLVTPAGAHVGTMSHLWTKHMKPLAVKLFFTKGQPTAHVWYYEHPYPPGAKSYNKGKPIRIEEFEGERAWWGSEKDGFATRLENEQAWRVSIDQIKAGNFNLDLKNPHSPDTGPGDVDHLLPEYEKLLAQIAETRGQLKAQLMDALSR